MKRVSIEPRKDYIKKIEELGFNFHTDLELGPYWLENAYYEFTMEEIEEIEKATNEGYRMLGECFEYVDNYDLWDLFGVPKGLIPKIKESWREDFPSCYGRFDFIISPEDGKPKILEFNGESATSLLEASVISWMWKDDVFPNNDQFNSIHEHLVNAWKNIHQYYGSEKYHFACCRESIEDHETTQYLLATAREAGLDTVDIAIEQLMYDEGNNYFYDPSGERIETCFKLYPLDWMVSDAPEAVEKGIINFIEPMWKSIYSNKAILPILYRLFPDSPYVLKASTSPVGMKDYVKKATLSREGQNVSIIKDGNIVEDSDGCYGDNQFIYQEYVDQQAYDGFYPVIGSWVCDNEACGMGIRDTKTKITDNMSLFTPHIII